MVTLTFALRLTWRARAYLYAAAVAHHFGAYRLARGLADRCAKAIRYEVV